MPAKPKNHLPASYPKSLQHITLVLDEGTTSELALQGFVRHIDDDGRLEIELQDNLNPDDFVPGANIVLQYNRNDVYYHFKSRIIQFSDVNFDQKKSGVAHRILIASQKNPAKIQRRDYFRISERMTVTLIKIVLPAHFLTDQSVRRKAMTEFRKLPTDVDLVTESLDLSGGGLGGLCDIELKLNHHYLTRFSIADKDFSIVAKVRHVDELKFGKFRVGLEFIGLSDRDREHIIRFVFKTQTQRLSKNKSN